MVEEFMRKHGFPMGVEPGSLPPTDLVRIQGITEEVAEYVDGVRLRDKVKMADALADLLYFAIGTAVTYGIPIEEVFAEVHRSNMTKAVKEARLRDKGEGYSPPDIAGVLRRHGC
jgi:NTP pyrophosphatase (non-canonical NTP hydrolase)